MKSYTYNAIHNSLVSNENSAHETSDFIINLNNKLISGFDNLDKEMLISKDVLIDLQVEKQR